MSKEIKNGNVMSRFVDKLTETIFPYEKQEKIEEIKPRVTYIIESVFPSQETRDKAMNVIRQKE